MEREFQETLEQGRGNERLGCPQGETLCVAAATDEPGEPS